MPRVSMPIVHRSMLLVAAGHAAPAPDDDDVRHCSLLLASVVSLLLLCGVLSVATSTTSTVAFTKVVYVIVVPAAVMLVFALFSWLVASGIRRALAAPPRAPAAAPARLARRLCACGLSHDAAGVATVLPAFPFQPAQQAAPTGDGERQAPRGSGVLCAVCLEDVRDGEMVRQLPACRHLFHVDCVDLWLRSHRTCPLCRCELPRRKATAQTQTTVAPVTSAATPEALPPLPPV